MGNWLLHTLITFFVKLKKKQIQTSYSLSSTFSLCPLSSLLQNLKVLIFFLLLCSIFLFLSINLCLLFPCLVYLADLRVPISQPAFTPLAQPVALLLGHSPSPPAAINLTVLAVLKICYFLLSLLWYCPLLLSCFPSVAEAPMYSWLLFSFPTFFLASKTSLFTHRETQTQSVEFFTCDKDLCEKVSVEGLQVDLCEKRPLLLRARHTRGHSWALLPT